MAYFRNISLFVFNLQWEIRYSTSQTSNKEMFSTATHIWFEVRTEIVLLYWRYLCENLCMAWNMNVLFIIKLELRQAWGLIQQIYSHANISQFLRSYSMEKKTGRSCKEQDRKRMTGGMKLRLVQRGKSLEWRVGVI